MARTARSLTRLALCILASFPAAAPAPAQERPPMPEALAPDVEARIAAIHERFVFADIHAHPSRFHRANVERIAPREIERYLRGDIDVVVATISTDAAYSGGYVKRDGTRVERGEHPRPEPGEAFAFTLDRFRRILRTIEEDDRVVLAESPEAVRRAREEGRVALMPALEGGDGLEGSLENLRTLHARGLRLLQIVHFRANELGHIQTYPYSPGGLTDFGRAAIREANRLGIVVDLAHANNETITDALEVSAHPMIFSHTGAAALHDGDRYVTDDEIRAIAAEGGVIGIWPYAPVVDDLDAMVRHIDHVVEVAGIDHVGIGSDLRGLGGYAEGFGPQANFHAIAAALFDAGYTDDEVGKVMGGNFFRVWQEVAGGVEVGSRWLKGNLHTHTLWSDGNDFPEMVLSWYRDHGYDFVALSDHNVLQEGERWVAVDRALAPAHREYIERFGEGWVEERRSGDTLRVRLRTLDELRGRLEEPGRFLIVTAEEITDRFGSKPLHVNATNLEELVEPRGGGSVREVLQRNVDAVLEQRERTGRPMIPHVNHPNFGWAVTVDDLAAVRGERFFEVYNGHPAVHNEGDAERPSTGEMWDIVLTRRLREGRPPIYGLAVDDAHHYHGAADRRAAPGRGWVRVRADDLSAAAIVEALEAGDFYASSGVEMAEAATVDGALRVRVRPEPGVEYTIRFIGTRREPPGAAGEVLAETTGPEASYAFRGDELYVRAKVSSTKIKEDPYREGEREAAWIQPVVPQER